MPPVAPYFTASNDPAELWAEGPSVRADCSRARISARGNGLNPLDSAGPFPKRAAIRERKNSPAAGFIGDPVERLVGGFLLTFIHVVMNLIQILLLGKETFV